MRYRGRVKPCCAAPANQHRVGWVDALVDRDVLDGTDHVLGCHVDDRSCCLVQAEPEFVGDLTLNGVGGGLGVEVHAPTQEKIGVDPAEYYGGVGLRRVGAPLSVADRSRPRAGATRPDMQEPALVNPCDAATAGANSLHVDCREAGHMAQERRTNPGLTGPGYPAVPH